VSSGQTDKKCLTHPEVDKHKMFAEQYEKTKVDSVAESLSQKNREKKKKKKSTNNTLL
jgi:hypothetical protein